jgi:hypothetical protein
VIVWLKLPSDGKTILEYFGESFHDADAEGIPGCFKFPPPETLAELPAQRQPLRDPRVPVIVSIATIPSRIRFMRPTLESLLNGDLIPDQILIVRPNFCKLENSDYVIPDFLQDPNFCQGIIKLVRCPMDWGPGNKLLGAIEYLPLKCYLILADDDVRYRQSFLADLIRSQQQDHRSSFSYFSYRVGGITLGQGCDGFSFWSPNLQGIRMFAHRFVKDTSLVYHDDLWISFFLAVRGISIRSLQPLLRGQLIYEQLLPNNALGSLAGRLRREEISRIHLPRLFKEADIPFRRMCFLRLIATWDSVRAFVSRGWRKVRNHLIVRYTWG